MAKWKHFIRQATVKSIVLSLCLVTLASGCSKTPVQNESSTGSQKQESYIGEASEWIVSGDTSLPSDSSVLQSNGGTTNSVTSSSSNGSSGSNNINSNEIAWWADFARFSNAPDMEAVYNVKADATTSVGDLFEDGVSPYAMETFYNQRGKTNIDMAQFYGIKPVAYLELAGGNRSIIGALHKTGTNKFEMHDTLNVPNLIAHIWNWATQGNGVNDKANQVVWIGTQAWVNRESWMGDLVMPKDFPTPTYPDGSSALGKLNGKANSIDPRDYKFFDAYMGKSIYGSWDEGSWQWGTATSNTKGFISVRLAPGKTGLVGEYFSSRDITSHWWVEYNRLAVRSMLKKGVRGFFVDNYTGYDYISSQPVSNGFGEWSVAGFRDYLKKHPISGIDASNFDIRDYLINKAKQKHGNIQTSWYYPDDLKYYYDESYLNDPVWLSYLAFKSEKVSEEQTLFYNMVKEEAKKLGINPNDVAVTGNDAVGMQNATMLDGTQMDVPSVEYYPGYSAVTYGWINQKFPDGYSAPYEKLAVQLGKSRRACLWYALAEGDPYEDGDYAKLLAFEALANNSTLATGSNGDTRIGNASSTMFVNEVIVALKKDFRDRDFSASVALYNSGNSEYCMLTPGGYAPEGKIPSTIAYYGWGRMLEKMNIPYHVVTEQQISKERLTNTNVLILGNINSISKSIVNNVLKPYLDSGKILVITGSNAGERDMRDGQFKKFSSPILVDLAKNYKGKGKIYYMENDPTIESCVNQSNKKIQADCEATLTNLFNDAEKSGKYTKDLILNGFNDQIQVATHSATKHNKFYVDLVNRNYDISKKAYVGKQTGKVMVKIPAGVKGSSFTVKINTVDSTSSQLKVTQKTVKASSGYILVDVPSFECYASIVISAK